MRPASIPPRKLRDSADHTPLPEQLQLSQDLSSHESHAHRSYNFHSTNQVLYAAIGCGLYLKFMFDIRIILSDRSNSQVILMPTSNMFLVKL